MNLNITSQGVFMNGVKQTGVKAFLYGFLTIAAVAVSITLAWVFFSIFLFALPFIIAIILLMICGTFIKNFSRKNTARNRNRNRDR